MPKLTNSQETQPLFLAPWPIEKKIPGSRVSVFDAVKSGVSIIIIIGHQVYKCSFELESLRV